MPYAVIFPGQGAASPGAGVPWQDHPAWSLVAEAESVLDRPLSRLLIDADKDELSTTRASQLADRLRTRVPSTSTVVLVELGAVVGAHVGPGTIAVAISPRPSGGQD